MNEEDFITNLTDFSDLRNKKIEQLDAPSASIRQIFTIDLDTSNNDKLMKTFKDLRQKLRSSIRQNTSLRQEDNINKVQIKQLLQSEKNLQIINHQLKEKLNHMNNVNQQLKKKNAILKESIDEKQALEEQLKFMKKSLVQVAMHSENLEEERKKLMEISVEEKMMLEERIQKFQLKRLNDEKYIQQMEMELSKNRENILKTQNQLKKMQIKYDEELFNKQWSKENFEKQHYSSMIQQLKEQLAETKNKNKRQKQKRADLEKRLLELEQATGLWNVKAETYEGQVDAMTKKMKKMEKKMFQIKGNSEKTSNQKLLFQEKFLKSVQITEQMISRAKRQVMGDIVELAKACQFKLNKLKDQQRARSVERKSSISKKKKVRSKDKEYETDDNYHPFTQSTPYFTGQKNFENSNRKVLIELSKNNPSSQSQFTLKNTINFEKNIYSDSKQNEESRQIFNIESKIRRQRQEMEKKLKEKMLYRKIEVSASPDKTRVRSQYLKLILDKKCI